MRGKSLTYIYKEILLGNSDMALSASSYMVANIY